MVLLQLGKEISSQTIGELSSSMNGEVSSGNSSLSNADSDVISEWKQELEDKKCELRHKTTTIGDLEERLREKEEEVCEAHNDFKSIQIERDKYCQMVSVIFNLLCWTTAQSECECKFFSVSLTTFKIYF